MEAISRFEHLVLDDTDLSSYVGEVTGRANAAHDTSSSLQECGDASRDAIATSVLWQMLEMESDHAKRAAQVGSAHRQARIARLLQEDFNVPPREAMPLVVKIYSDVAARPLDDPILTRLSAVHAEARR